jgi:hypothetical protein
MAAEAERPENYSGAKDDGPVVLPLAAHAVL